MEERIEATATMMVPSAIMDDILERLSDLIESQGIVLCGVKAALVKLKDKLWLIKDHLIAAEVREIQDADVRRWLNKVKDIMCDVEDIINCSFDMHKSTSYYEYGSSSMSTAPPCVALPFLLLWSYVSYVFNQGKSYMSRNMKVKGIFHHYKTGKRIEAINERMEQIHKDRDQLKLVQTVRNEGFVPPRLSISQPSETTSLIIESETIGLEVKTEHLVAMLEEPNVRGACVFAIVGMGGIGKTTLAQKVFKKSKNFDTRIWVCVSQDFKETDVLKQIISSAGGYCNEAQSRRELYSLLMEVLRGKRFLLVLDDLWSDQVWNDCLRDPFRGFMSSSSKVLITTRIKEIAWRMGAAYIHEMEALSYDDAWSLLCKVVAPGEDPKGIDHLKDVGMKIIENCKGLPLAIKVIGGVLQRKSRTKWEEVISYTTDFSPGIMPALEMSYMDLPSKKSRTEGEEIISTRDSSSRIMPALELSYMDLPSNLKQCFLYCSLFPKDYHISQTQLTRIWIALDLVKAGGGISIENSAEFYLKDLVRRSLLQMVDASSSSSYIKEQEIQSPLYSCFEDVDIAYKMSDLVRKIAIFITAGGDLVKPRHQLNFGVEELKDIPDRVQSLKSLLVFQSYNMKEIPHNLFDRLKHLRVLSLNGTEIQYVPNSLGKLMQLRYLDLSNTLITELPDALCNLHYLQTLDLSGCLKLNKLPKDLSRLQRLRHFHVESQHVIMPEGLGRLVHLQTLWEFRILIKDSDGVQCNIVELGSLSELTRLAIEGLDRVPSGIEAHNAMMCNMIHLTSLKLGCGPMEEVGEEKSKVMERIEEVFEYLHPSPSLYNLWVSNFFGRDLPSWISMGELLPNLKFLELKGLPNLQQLPSLVHLRNLKQLRVWDICSIVNIGADFVFGQGQMTEDTFPSLEILSFRGMDQWSVWSDSILEGSGGEGKIKQQQKPQILPRLRSLELIHCPVLKSLPWGLLRHATNLTELYLGKLEMLEEIGGLDHVKTLHISQCSKLKSLRLLPQLLSLEVTDCPALEDVAKLQAASLRDINFHVFMKDISPKNEAALESLERMKAGYQKFDVGESSNASPN
ncbi:putative disease resistance RPP13-like protein 1 [Acorus calamus]|uniref:Disease resistance RPP13-like protein 1 n=1 Tax=Acorus calamus TaxID=4465 RepID=A0AAV9D3C6_ACOCL|nr:putative disease resistance RPP13-like protein 1 [Acorus calamus]